MHPTLRRTLLSILTAVACAAAQPPSNPADPSRPVPGERKEPVQAPRKAASGKGAGKAVSTGAPKGPLSPEATVISVGPNKIRKSQIDTLVDLMIRARHQDGSQPRPGETEYLEKMVATNLIGQQLLDLEAKRLHVTAEPAAVDSLSRAFRANFPNQKAFLQALREAGDTEAGLREKMERQIKSDKLLNSQVTRVEPPTESEMKDFFAARKSSFPINDSLRACQILFLLDKNASSAEILRKKTELDKVRGELAADSAHIDRLLTRFVLKARDISDGPEKNDGGDLQRFLPGDFHAEFRKQVAALRVGDMSPVFRTPLGWHLVLLTERNDGKFESYRLQIARALVAEKAADAGRNLKKYLQSLAARYKVAYLAEGYRDTSVSGVYAQ